MKVGVPSSAGAYCIGVERAPYALRMGGLVEALAAEGAQVMDAGDLTTRRWKPDRHQPRVQNLDDEVASIRELADVASVLLAEGELLLVLGGSCTVAFGVCAAIARQGGTPNLVYIDRHLDLNTPLSTDEGSLSWMGMAHALGLDGAARELVEATQDTAILEPSRLVYLGVDDTQATEWERTQVRDLAITVVPQAQLTHHPRQAAEAARAALPAGPFVVHLDVDVLDFLDAPIAENVNGRNSGPSLAQLEPALAALIGHPDCRALSIAQLDPAHAGSDDTALPRFVAVLAAAVAARQLNAAG
ncbi:arginase family protein [Conyzicola sp.]|uniref:arginase family protein n=1 Tax=Conyzicola sp. TaxID=1969404 RepID=UPI003989F701